MQKNVTKKESAHATQNSGTKWKEIRAVMIDRAKDFLGQKKIKNDWITYMIMDFTEANRELKDINQNEQ